MRIFLLMSLLFVISCTTSKNGTQSNSCVCSEENASSDNRLEIPESYSLSCESNCLKLAPASSVACFSVKFYSRFGQEMASISLQNTTSESITNHLEQELKKLKTSEMYIYKSYYKINGVCFVYQGQMTVTR